MIFIDASCPASVFSDNKSYLSMIAKSANSQRKNHKDIKPISIIKEITLYIDKIITRPKLIKPNNSNKPDFSEFMYKSIFLSPSFKPK